MRRSSFSRVLLPVCLTLLAETPYLLAATNLTSRPVAVLRLSVQPGESKLVGAPVWPFNPDINEVLRNQLTASSNEAGSDLVLKYDVTIPGYLRAVRGPAASIEGRTVSWYEDLSTLRASELTIEPGEGFFLVNRQTCTQQVFIAGEVVAEPQEIEFAMPPGLSLFSFPFTSAGTLDGLDPADEVRRADGTVVARDGVPAPLLSLGSAYWYWRRGLESLTWRVSRPYSNPLFFPRNDDPPRVASLTVSAAGRVQLGILTAGVAGEKLDIYSQNVASTNCFNPLAGWRPRALDIQVAGRSQVVWDEPADSALGTAESTTMRAFIAARGDLDLDGNGLPDARELLLGAGPWTPGGNPDGDPGGEPGDDAAWTTNFVDVVIGTNEFGGIHDTVPEPRRRPARVIYVDKRIGGDHLSGRTPVVVGVNGPKKTIAAGLAETGVGDLLLVREGAYGEDLNVADRAISVRFVGHVDLTGSRKPPPAPDFPSDPVTTNITFIRP